MAKPYPLTVSRGLRLLYLEDKKPTVAAIAWWWWWTQDLTFGKKRTSGSGLFLRDSFNQFGEVHAFWSLVTDHERRDSALWCAADFSVPGAALEAGFGRSFARSTFSRRSCACNNKIRHPSEPFRLFSFRQPEEHLESVSALKDTCPNQTELSSANHPPMLFTPFGTPHLVFR